MIYFHEGLPRSGKSYEAVAERIVPALAAGRPVVAYVEGLDIPKLADLAKITPERAGELVRVLSREDMERWLEFTQDNALHVFDEAQEFWNNRAKLSQLEQRFVAEHGHRGIDIVLMGQDYRDVHALWRRRIEVRLAFLKLTGLGMSGRYSVTTFRHQGGDVWVKVGTHVRSYDPRFFGAYKSFVAADTNTGVMVDSRAQVWRDWRFRIGVPLVALALLGGTVYVFRFFNPSSSGLVASRVAPPAGPASSAAGPPAARPEPPQAVQPQAAPSQAPARPTSPAEKFLSDLSQRARIRLAGVARLGGKTLYVVEWIDGAARVVERLTSDQLQAQGVALIEAAGVLRVFAGSSSWYATPWPIEADLRVSENRLDAMRPKRADDGEPTGGVSGFNSSTPVRTEASSAAAPVAPRPRVGGGPR